MAYDVDYDFDFKRSENDMPYLPENLTMDGNLYVLPNGKYLPSGCYITNDGGHLIYEPPQLSPFSDMLAQFNK